MWVTLEMNNNVVVVSFVDVLRRTACGGGRVLFGVELHMVCIRCRHVDVGKALFKWRVL